VVFTAEVSTTVLHPCESLLGTTVVAERADIFTKKVGANGL